jgi:hypothetical protein
MLVLGNNSITEANELNEYRLSNKEFRMTKFKISIVPFDILHSLFDILRFALELPLFSVCSSLLAGH